MYAFPMRSIDEMLQAVRERDKQTRVPRSFRVREDIARDYAIACKKLGVSNSELLEQFMKDIITKANLK